MVNEQFLNTFLTESEDLMREIEAQLLKLEAETDDEDAINALFRSVHTLKGSSGMVGITSIEQFLHWVESVMEKVRIGTLEFNEQLADLMLKAYDHLGILVDRISIDQTETIDPEIAEQEESIVKKLQSYLAEYPDSGQADADGMQQPPPDTST